eukprot:3497391-Rhodomonas_salina.1
MRTAGLRERADMMIAGVTTWLAAVTARMMQLGRSITCREEGGEEGRETGGMGGWGRWANGRKGVKCVHVSALTAPRESLINHSSIHSLTIV